MNDSVFSRKAFRSVEEFFVRNKKNLESLPLEEVVRATWNEGWYSGRKSLHPEIREAKENIKILNKLVKQARG